MAKSANRMSRTCGLGVLVRRLHVACDNIRPWYLIKDKLCLYESVGEKCEEGSSTETLVVNM